MTAATLPAPAPAETCSGVCHLYHPECTPSMSWCGADIRGVPDGRCTPDEPDCPLCLLADDTGMWACCGGAS